MRARVGIRFRLSLLSRLDYMLLFAEDCRHFSAAFMP